VLVVHVELDHRLAAEGLLAVGRGAIRQILIVPLGTRGVHHQSTAVIVVVRVALVTPDGTGFGRKSKQGGNTLINCTLIIRTIQDIQVPLARTKPHTNHAAD